MTKRLLAFAFCITNILNFASAQTPKCLSHIRSEARLQQNPSLRAVRQQAENLVQAQIRRDANNPNRAESVVTVPVVFHVVYKTTTQNISDAQIQSQITVLNQDYRKLNTDAANTPAVWKPIAADAQIQFCLATRTPTGAVSNGITRTLTTKTRFANTTNTIDPDDVKFTSTGGIEGWDPTRYLNIWVCRLDDFTYGYTYLPGDLAQYPEYDGIVVDYRAVGNIGTAGTGGTSFVGLADKGRTLTHEVGHWFNLEHIWGDGDGTACLSDFVDDTPPADVENSDCPTFPRKVGAMCTTDPSGQMFMNYMDYVQDNCMNIFTVGQAARMTATLNGIRLSIRTSNSCAGAIAVEMTTFDAQSDGKRNLLHWHTASERNNAYFSVERSFDGNHFTEISQVKGNGSTTEQHDYGFADASATAAVVYYRLRQVDFDRTFAYSNVVSIQNRLKTRVKIFPNPVGTEGVTLQIEANGDKFISLTDVAGRLVASLKTTENSVNLTTANLPTGLYFCTIRLGGGEVLSVEKLVVR